MSNFKSFRGIYFLIFASFCFSLLLVGCYRKSDRSPRSVIRLALSSEPPDLDPGKATDNCSGVIINMCHESLMRLNSNGSSECGLAERYAISNGGKTYTFYIRPEARWSNGDPITAYDFEYAWKQILDPSVKGGKYAYQLYCIKNAEEINRGKLSLDQLGVQVINDRVIAVELKNPLPYFLDLIAFYSFCPVNRNVATKNSGWAENATEDYICSGPFRLVYWKHQYGLRLVKNENYWNSKLVRPKKIEIDIITDATTCLNMFESGAIDFMGPSPYGEIPIDALVNFKKGKVKRARTAVSMWLECNLERRPLANKNIRKGLAFAINRKAIADNVVPGMFTATTHFLPAVLRRNHKPLFEDNSPELARQYFAKGLEESGLTAKDFKSLSILSIQKSGYTKINQAIQQQWREVLGIEVSLRDMDFKVVLNQLKEGSFDLARNAWIADICDASNFLDVYLQKGFGNNVSGWESIEYQSIMADAANETSREKRQLLLENAEQVLVEDLPIIPIMEPNANILINPKLKGTTFSVTGTLDLRHAYIEN